MFDKAKKASKIIITKHAKERALARARLVLYAHEKDDIESFLRRDFMNATEDRTMVMSPFYTNKYKGKHGEGSFTMSSNIFKYMGKYLEKDNVTIITTVAYIKN